MVLEIKNPAGSANNLETYQYHQSMLNNLHKLKDLNINIPEKAQNRLSEF